jgi:hypothetical protein
MREAAGIRSDLGGSSFFRALDWTGDDGDLRVAQHFQRAVLARVVARIEDELVEGLPESQPGEHPPEDVDDRGLRIVAVARVERDRGDRESEESDGQADSQSTQAAALRRPPAALVDV